MKKKEEKMSQESSMDVRDTKSHNYGASVSSTNFVCSKITLTGKWQRLARPDNTNKCTLSSFIKLVSSSSRARNDSEQLRATISPNNKATKRLEETAED